jgi:hypothetical protein
VFIRSTSGDPHDIGQKESHSSLGLNGPVGPLDHPDISFGAVELEVPVDETMVNRPDIRNRNHLLTLTSRGNPVWPGSCQSVS